MARNKWGRKEEGGGGEGGTDNYNDLSNKPKINGHTLSGNKTASDLGLASSEDLEGKIDTPESAGTEGQVLTLDENGNPVWEDPQGGGGGGSVDSVNGMTGDVVLGASDVGALPDTTTVPSALSQLTDDSTHRTVTDSEKSTWNAKANKVAKRVVTELTSAIELQPNEMCVLTNVGTTLAVTLATPADNTIVNEYMLEFDTGATPPSVSFPGTVVFPTALSVKANKHYQFSIIDNIALYISA